MSITLLIVIATVIVSISAFNNQRTHDDLIFYPPAITERRQWYRFLSYGLIHADWFHLAFNMLALYSFGKIVENGFNYTTGIDNGFIQIFGDRLGKLLYLSMYVLALIISILPTYAKHKDDYHYRGLGASGAVSAVVFAAILLEPRSGVSMMFLPVSIPGYIFGPLYLLISSWLAKRGRDNINHSAHIWGAIFGIVFILLACQLFSSKEPVRDFIRSVKLDL